MIDLPPNQNFLSCQAEKITEVRYLSHCDIARVSNLVADAPAPPFRKNSHSETSSVYVAKITKHTTDFSLPIAFMKLPSGKWRLEHQAMGNPNDYCLNFIASEAKVAISLCGTESTPPLRNSPDKSQRKQHCVEWHKELPELYGKEFKSVRYENWNGKQVLVKEGHFASNNVDVYMLAFDDEPNKNGVEGSTRLTFEAPPERFKSLIDEVKAAFRTIKWNKDATR